MVSEEFRNSPIKSHSGSDIRIQGLLNPKLRANALMPTPASRRRRNSLAFALGRIQIARRPRMISPAPQLLRSSNISLSGKPERSSLEYRRESVSRMRGSLNALEFARIQTSGSHSAISVRRLAPACHWIPPVQDQTEFQFLVSRKNQTCHLSRSHLLQAEPRDEKKRCWIEKFRP